MKPAIDMYNVNDQTRRQDAHAAYVAHADFAQIEAKAASKGFRHATMREINHSATSEPGAQDLFCWRGGLWARTSDE